MAALKQETEDVYVTDLAGNATITVRRWVRDEHAVDAAASELRLAVHDRLRALGALS